jgi:hypothetical protein
LQPKKIKVHKSVAEDTEFMKKKQPKFNISETGAFRKYLQITITP